MKSQHRRATLANLVCSLIKHSRIQTTIAMAKVARRYADKMVTLAKKGTVDHTQYDTASILRLITRRFGLPTLGGLAARVGGAGGVMGAARVVLLGALAMAVTAGIGSFFG